MSADSVPSIVCVSDGPYRVRLLLPPSSARREDHCLMMVVDASAVVDVLLQTETGMRIEARLFAPSETLHVPHLIDIEVAHALRRAWQQGLIDGHELRQGWMIWRPGRSSAMRTIFSCCVFGNCVTAYDAAYVALAETLAVTLLTCDARLASSSGHNAVIEIA